MPHERPAHHAPARPGTRAWWSALVALTFGSLALLVGPATQLTWESPLSLFVIVTVAASLCALGALALLWVAHRDDNAGVGLLASGFVVVSVLPLVHGLTAPGVLYGPNSAVALSVYVALPLAVVTWAPLATRSSRFTRCVGHHWRAWSATAVLGATAIAVVLLVRPNLATVPARSSVVTIAVATFGYVGAIWLSRNQLRLYWIGERASTLAAAVALLLLGTTSLVWFGDGPFTLGWWLVHALDILGVLGGIVAVWRSHRLRRPVVETLAPVVTRDPLIALELGLAPVVHRFVRSLEAKDPVTRDHVVRTGELAIRTGEALGLDERRLRYLGLAALLHDVGKLDTPAAILEKPGALTDEEYEIIRRHPAAGEAMLQSVPSLAGAAGLVRAHHERMDGTGYPDGVRAGDLPIEVRIIAVCDAYDAMAHTRQYRAGMGHERAVAILREHAGSQWDAEVVEVVVAVASRAAGGSAVRDGPTLDAVGRASAVGCGCADALPAAVVAQLTSV